MSKNAKVINFNKKRTEKHSNEYIEMFKEYIQNDCKGQYSINNMIGAVAIINAVLLTRLNNINDEQADEIIVAYHYIADKMLTSKKNERKIFENWGDYPLLFRVGSSLEYEKSKAIIDCAIKSFSREEKELFDKILDKVWNIREKRRISLDGIAIPLPKTIRKDELEEYYYLVKRKIVDFMIGNSETGVFIFAKERPDGDVISALMNSNGNISIVVADKLKWSYSHNPMTGKFIGAPKGEKYEDFIL